MNILIDRIITCLHWFDMFFPGRQDKIDWKEVGQMRFRLVQMRFGNSESSASKEARSLSDDFIPRPMLSDFRTLNNKARDREGLTRWYVKEDMVSKEKQLLSRIEAGRRAHEARQTSGAYPLISAEDADAIYDVKQQQKQHLSKATEAKLSSFLSGTTDDINELLFTDLNSVEEKKSGADTPTGLATKFPSLTRIPSKPAVKDAAVIAAP